MSETLEKNQIITLAIENISNMGHGIAHAKNGMVVFVQHGVMGDQVEAKIIKVTKDYAIARIENFLEKSPYRIENNCMAKDCGGCIFRNLSYEKEKAIKEENVRYAFVKNGLADVKINPLVSLDKVERYRNKAEYPFGEKNGKVFVGFYAENTHRVSECSDCKLLPEVFNEIAKEVCEFANAHHISVYDETTGKGLLRHLYLRTSQKGEILVTLVLNGKNLPFESEFVARSIKNPNVVGVLLNFNEKNTNVVLGKEYRTLYGEKRLKDTLLGVEFSISPDAFYQVNHDMCEKLYSLVSEKANLSGEETLVDLYCGIGSIGLTLAKNCKRLIGIEMVEGAVKCAEKNAKANGIKNAEFFCGDASNAESFLASCEAKEKLPKDAVVIIDPPRKGTTKELIDTLANREFEKIIYVSCNPDTLARDCKYFREKGYTIGEVTPVDLFPRTGHVESVVELTHSR